MYAICVGSYDTNRYILCFEVSGDEAAYDRFDTLAEGFDGTDYYVELMNDETGDLIASTYEEREDD